MKLVKAVESMCEAFGLLDASVASSPAKLEAMLAEIGATECDADQFLGIVKQLQPRQAANLLTCALHRSSAYASHEFMPLAEARQLAAEFIDAAGPGASFYVSDRPLHLDALYTADLLQSQTLSLHFPTAVVPDDRPGPIGRDNRF